MEGVPSVEELRKLSKTGAEERDRERLTQDAKAVEDFKEKLTKAAFQATAKGDFSCRIPGRYDDAIVRAVKKLGFKVRHPGDTYVISWLE